MEDANGRPGDLQPYRASSGSRPSCPTLSGSIVQGDKVDRRLSNTCGTCTSALGRAYAIWLIRLSRQRTASENGSGCPKLVVHADMRRGLRRSRTAFSGG